MNLTSNFDMILQKFDTNFHTKF